MAAELYMLPTLYLLAVTEISPPSGFCLDYQMWKQHETYQKQRFKKECIYDYAISKKLKP